MGFDSTRLLAWFETVDPSAVAGVGDLCGRHSAAMVLPRGWTLEDRRPGPASTASTAAPAAAPARRRPATARTKRRKKWEEAPGDLFAPSEPAPEPVATVPAPVLAPEPPAPEPESGPESEPAWTPQFEVDDLDGLLSAKSPLLSRAFRAAKNG